MKFNCSNIKTPKDITSQCDYKDEFPQGRNDNKWVSCCQGDKNSHIYDELERFYNKNFNNLDKRKYSEGAILKAMCECCNEKAKDKNNWDWGKYKECVHKKIEVYLILQDYFKFQ